MPSNQDPSTILTGPGRVHVDVVSAAADLYNAGSAATLAQLAAVIAQPLAAPSSKVYTAGVSGDATRVMAAIDGPFYVGDSPIDEIQDLFEVVTASDDSDIFNVTTHQFVRIASITPASIGSGFSTVALTIIFTTPVPANLQYRIYYGRRVTVSNLPVELASNPMIRRSSTRSQLLDGSVQSYGGRVRGFLSRRALGYHNISTNNTFGWNPHVENSLTLRFIGTTTKVLTLTLAAGYTPQDGDILEVFILNTDTTNPSTVVWPASFKFSGTDDDVSGVSPGGLVMKFVGTYTNGNCYFTRTDYEV